VPLNAAYLGVQLGDRGGAAALFLLPRVGPARGRLRRTPHLLGVTALGAALVVLRSARGLGPDQRQMLAEPYPPDRCHGENPVVCYYPQHQRMAEPSYEAIADFAQRARQAGYHDLIPDAIHETSRSYFPTDPEIQGLHISAREYEGRPPDPPSLIWNVLYPHHCRQWDGYAFDLQEPLFDLFLSLTEGLFWLYAIEGPNGPVFDVDQGSEFFDLPPDFFERLRPEEVSEIAAQVRSCQV